MPCPVLRLLALLLAILPMGAAEVIDIDLPVEELLTDDPHDAQDPSPDVDDQGDDGQDEDDGSSLAKIIDKLDCGREPAAVLTAMAVRRLGRDPVDEATDQNDDDPEAAAIRHEARELQLLVRCGDWAGLAAAFAAMPQERAQRVYPVLLGQLGSGVLLPRAVWLLADMAPTDELPAPLYPVLAGLLRQGLEQIGSSRAMMADLRTGIGRFGGDEPAGRAHAARLLLEAGRVLEAGAFLPDRDRAEAAGALADLDLHARYHTARHAAEGDATALDQAWRLTRIILEHPDCDAGLFFRAAHRADELLRHGRKRFGEAWFARRAAASLAEAQADPLLLALFAATTARHQALAQSKGPPPQRHELLASIARRSSLLLEHLSDPQPWRDPLNLLALVWLEEARYSLQFADNPPGGNTRQPIDLAAIRVVAPGPAWRSLLDGAIAERVGESVCRLAVGEGDTAAALPLITQLYPIDVETAIELANRLVHVWTDLRDSDAHQSYGHHPYHWRSNSINAFPTTRARQVLALEELSGLVAALRREVGDGLEGTTVVRAFAAAHSPAEVYRREDIAAVFGPIDLIAPATLAQLAGAMRQRLARQWRQPPVQQQAGTKRDNAAIAAEVERGYDLVTGLLDEALVQTDHRLLHRARAMVLFDHAEFRYGQEAPLEAYTTLREASFSAMARAAERYQDHLDAAATTEADPSLFVDWFSLTLGASDVSYLTRQGAADEDQLAQINAQLDALGSERAQAHRDAFAQAIRQGRSQVPGHRLVTYLEAARTITGEHARSAWIDADLDRYRELLAEIRFVTRIDGPSGVGTEPFLLHVALQATAPVMRETDDLRIHLKDQVYTGTGEPVDYRSDLEDHIRTTLGEDFTIVDCRVHEQQVPLRILPDTAWRELPLACVLLRANDPAVDTLPSLRKDLDFQDRGATISFPRASEPLLIDARERDPVTGSDNLACELVLDAREQADDRLLLEITFTGDGLIPSTDAVLAPAAGGWQADATEDVRYGLTEIDCDGQQIRAGLERMQRRSYRPNPDADPSHFAFPTPREPGLEPSLHRYADIEVVEATPVIALDRGPATRKPAWWWWLAGAAVVLAGLALGLIRARRRQPAAAADQDWRPPATEASAARLSYLRRIQHQGPLKEAERSALGSELDRLQDRLFTRDGDHTAAAEALGELSHHWQRRVGS
ncbi:MAG: hypothetical protein ACOCYV_01055 [Planctomycetota bacterium]